MDFYRPLGAAPHLELVNPTRARLLELLETAPELLELTPAADPVGVARCRAAAAKFLRAVSRR